MTKKRALITGGGGEIGRAICQRLANDQMHVIVHTGHHYERAEVVADLILAEGGSAETTIFDVTDEVATHQALMGLLEAGPIQVLVNNVGIHDDAPLAGMKPSQWQRVIEVSLHGFFNVTQPLLLPMMATRWGRIINISSLAGVTGNRGQSNYAAAKAGLHGATKSLALEVATRGVTVNAIAPGLITSQATARFDAAMVKTLVPMRRMGTPAEVANLVSFVASEQAGYLTGQILSLNGGIV